ncbi:hypothetical protein ALNOE001_05210 [Candidatus Methanobinarius endosymbioticus]|uniref:DUF4234 domain-containing protein n=1 Tax=Candidatus Methanobinarius endosymbioticus TaxID=2006182 RepID=A0A366ME24_9EURY|nr:hypothetical protein ALNOE001_05210 [Candidatus Methanobinarius endosymbioticus]
METKKTKYCVYCGEKIAADGEKCEHCGEWFESSSVSRNHILNSYVPEETIEEEEIETVKVNNTPVDNTNNIDAVINSINSNKKEDSNINHDLNNYNDIQDNNYNNHQNNDLNNRNNISKYSNILPIRRFFLLMFLTGGLYVYYWVYKTNCYLKDDLGKDVSPGLRTFLMFIPIANIIVFYQTIEDMNNFIKREGIESYSSVLNTLIHVFLGYLLSFWVYINIQESINEFWRIKEPNLPVKREFSNPEIIVMFLGAILWILYFALIFLMAFLAPLIP